MRQSMRLAAKQQRATADEEKARAPPPSTSAAPAPATTQQRKQPSKKQVAAARLPPPPTSSAPLPSFSFKRVPSASVPLASAAAPPIVLGSSSSSSSSSSSAAPGGVAPVRAQKAQRKRIKSIKAQETEATGGMDHEGEEEEGPFDNDAGLDMAGLGSNEDVDVFVSALGVAEEEGEDDPPSYEASYYAAVAPLVSAYAGGALPSFADAAPTHIPVLSGEEAAVVDWKGPGPGLAAVRSIMDLVQAHEAGGAVNFARLAVVRGRVVETAPSGALLNAGSSAYILCLGSRGVSLSLSLPGEDEPLRLLLSPGAMVKLGSATAAAVTRTTLAPLVKESAGAGAAVDDKALVLFLYDTARVRDLLTGKVLGRAAPTAAQGKKRKAAGPPVKKKGKAEKEEDADHGGEDASDKENEGPKQVAAVAATAAAGAKSKKKPAQPKQAPAVKGKDARRKALHTESANAAKGAAKKAKK